MKTLFNKLKLAFNFFHSHYALCKRIQESTEKEKELNDLIKGYRKENEIYIHCLSSMNNWLEKDIKPEGKVLAVSIEYSEMKNKIAKKLSIQKR